MLRRKLVFALGMALIGGPACAKVAHPTWSAIAETAPVIALVRVEAVETLAHTRMAVARVIEPVTGVAAGERLCFRAQPVWACDDSTAEPGETVLVLLKPLEQGVNRTAVAAAAQQRLGKIRCWEISWHGWGRLAARRHQNSWQVVRPTHYREEPPAIRAARGEWLPFSTVRAELQRLRARSAPRP